MLKEHLIDRIFQFDHLDDLDADCFSCLVVDALVDRAAVALADVFADFIRIVLYCFHHFIVIFDINKKEGILLERIMSR